MPLMNNSSLKHQAVLEAVRLIANGQAPDPDAVSAVDYTYSHKRNVPTGAGAVDLSLDFFNENDSEGLTNWPGTNGLPNDHVFVMDGVGIEFINGFDRDGTAISGGGSFDAASGVTTLAQANAIDAYLKHGRFTLQMGKREILDINGLHKLPSGGGSVFSALANPAVTEDGAFALLSNGVPSVINRPLLSPRQYVTPGDSIRGKLRAKFSSLTHVALVCRVDLFGVLVSPIEK